MRSNLACWLAVGSIMTAGCGGRDQVRPNIVLINVDTLRADYLGSYGFQGDVSPNLDRLAEQSVVFLNCHAQSPWTKPSVASLFTSFYPQVHGVTDHDGKYWSGPGVGRDASVLPESATTLAERLRDAGYRTGAVVANPWLGKAYGFAQGFEHYDDEPSTQRALMGELRRRAHAWLDTLEPGEPYFLYIHPMDVHAPYDAPRTDYDAVAPSSSLGEDAALGAREVPHMRWSNIETRPEWATDEMRRRLAYWRARYASGVRALDRRLSQFLTELRRREDFERTLVVITSDHGEELYEHGDWSHGQNLYEHQLHVPLIVYDGSGNTPGKRVADVVELVDVMPALAAAAAAGADTDAALDPQGRDISPLWGSNERATVPRIDATFATATQHAPALFSVMTGEHKLIHDFDRRVSELYDLASDPGEQRRLGNLRLIESLRRRIDRHIAESTRDGTLSSESIPLDRDAAERLKALGYLD